MGSRYKLLVIDLDGTLLDGRGVVSARNREAIGEAMDAGMAVMIATGRSWIESHRAIDGLGLVDPMVAAGGSLLCDVTSGKTLRRSVLDHELVADVVASFHRHGHLAHLLKDPSTSPHDYVVVGDGELDRATRWWFDTLPVRVRYAAAIHEDEHPHETVRVGTVASAGTLAGVASDLERDLGERIFFQHWSAVTADEPTGSGTHLLEVFSPAVSKWSMVAQVCAERGFGAGEVAAIGDGLNDLEMVREAGLGIAMGNADARIKDVAKRETASHAEDGVAEAIGMMLRGVW